MGIWLLIFNCTVMPVRSGAKEEKPQGTNLVFHLEKSYKTESACLKDAKKGASQVDANAGCYFSCVWGFKGSHK